MTTYSESNIVVLGMWMKYFFAYSNAALIFSSPLSDGFS